MATLGPFEMIAAVECETTSPNHFIVHRVLTQFCEFPGSAYINEWQMWLFYADALTYSAGDYIERDGVSFNVTGSETFHSSYSLGALAGCSKSTLSNVYVTTASHLGESSPNCDDPNDVTTGAVYYKRSGGAIVATFSGTICETEDLGCNHFGDGTHRVRTWMNLGY